MYLLIIGIIGGTVKQQQLVLSELSQIFGARGITFRLPDSQAFDILKNEFNPKKLRADRVALANISDEAAIAWLREKGAYLWHLSRTNHRVVYPDQIVSTYSPDIQNALSNSILAYRNAAALRQQR